MQVKEDCLETFAASEEITVQFCRERPLAVRMIQSLMRPLCTASIAGWEAAEYTYYIRKNRRARRK